MGSKTFDVATAANCLHYSDTVEKLSGAIRSVHNVLRSGGRFLGLVGNPMPGFKDQPKEWLHKYGSIVYDRENATNGDLRQAEISFFDGTQRSIHLENFYWDKETYEKAFKDAGFS